MFSARVTNGELFGSWICDANFAELTAENQHSQKKISIIYRVAQKGTHQGK